MKRIGLIRLGGLAAMAGGVMYSVLGVMAGVPWVLVGYAVLRAGGWRSGEVGEP